MKKNKSVFKKFSSGVLLASVITLYSSSSFAELDPNIENAALEVVLAVSSPILSDPGKGITDPSFSFRKISMTGNAWFDAIAPYHPTSVGIHSKIPNRPESERNNVNRNIAIIYSSYRVLQSLYPEENTAWRNMLSDVGLNPDDNSTDITTPVGIGNVAGAAVAEFRARDGSNQLGDEGGCKYNCIPFSDYTGYKPKNSSYKLKYPSRWQPRAVSQNGDTGLLTDQHFVFPHIIKTKSYAISDLSDFIAPFPTESRVSNFREYKAQADRVLEVSANLTEEQKLKAELFDNKIGSLLGATTSVIESLGLDVSEFVYLNFATSAAAFDTAKAVWFNKRKYDAVRPYSAIPFIYGTREVSAWGGPGKGTVHDMPATQWDNYLPVAPHPEYPSGSASFCAAYAQVARLMYGEHSIDFSFEIPAGGSVIEPGVTPEESIVLEYYNWSDFEYDCGQSRLWGGVHFPASIPAGQDIGRPIGEIVYNFVMDHIQGTVAKD